MKSIAKIEFDSPVNRDNGYTNERLAENAHSTMELFIVPGKPGSYCEIEWVIDSLDEVTHIGIYLAPLAPDDGNWLDSPNLRYALDEYDGVFDLPEQAITLLESVGIVVGPEFREEEA